MALITLTSDLGHVDPYLATVKGRILGRCPGARLVDVSHDVRPYDIKEAAWAVRYAWPHFPEQTIHWIGLDSQQVESVRYLVVVHHNHYFIGADDGLFALLFDHHPEFIFAIRNGISLIHGETGIFSDSVFAASYLAGGGDILEIADQVREIESRTALRAPELPDAIRATVIHVDRFGNAVLDVNRETIERVGRGRKCYLRFRRQERIDGISETYSDVLPGERLFLYNGAGQLEIAVNQGNASGLLGLDVNDTVQVAFE